MLIIFLLSIAYHILCLLYIVDSINIFTGLCGPETFVMFVIGGAMMMEAMVCVAKNLFISAFECFISYLMVTNSILHFPVVLFQSREHPNCGPQPGFVRAHLESNFSISF